MTGRTVRAGRGTDRPPRLAAPRPGFSEGTVVARALGLGPDDTGQFLNRGLVLRPEHHIS